MDRKNIAIEPQQKGLSIQNCSYVGSFDWSTEGGRSRRCFMRLFDCLLTDPVRERKVLTYGILLLSLSFFEDLGTTAKGLRMMGRLIWIL